eukprot:TRINITY_DN2071_c0_g1_i6.p1 TRINITY_DN2071_c0_g1~~TRINITY_DN2071_c0_g1_i6.p1  ORF type:complete len:431 (+),score=108.81 TRINITY_DN2071_c0_g1_i6:453-1745(+)
MALGIVYHQLGKEVKAEENYVIAINALSKLRPLSLDMALTNSNYATLLLSLNRQEDALAVISKTCDILRHIPSAGIYLGTSLSNLAVLYFERERKEESLQLFQEALDSFLNSVGRDNDMTRSAFSNLYFILNDLGLTSEIENLREKWETCNKIQSSEVQGLSNEEVANIVEEFSYTIRKAEPKLNPVGFTKGPNLYRREVAQFLEYWSGKCGRSIQPNYLDVLKQESAAIRTSEVQLEKMKLDLKEKRDAVVKQRTETYQIEGELHMKELENKRFRKDKIIWEREEKNTTTLANEAGFDAEELNRDGSFPDLSHDEMTLFHETGYILASPEDEITELDDEDDDNDDAAGESPYERLFSSLNTKSAEEIKERYFSKRKQSKGRQVGNGERGPGLETWPDDGDERGTLPPDEGNDDEEFEDDVSQSRWFRDE